MQETRTIVLGEGAVAFRQVDGGRMHIIYVPGAADAGDAADVGFDVYVEYKGEYVPLTVLDDFRGDVAGDHGFSFEDHYGCFVWDSDCWLVRTGDTLNCIGMTFLRVPPMQEITVRPVRSRQPEYLFRRSDGSLLYVSSYGENDENYTSFKAYVGAFDGDDGAMYEHTIAPWIPGEGRTPPRVCRFPDGSTVIVIYDIGDTYGPVPLWVPSVPRWVWVPSENHPIFTPMLGSEVLERLDPRQFEIFESVRGVCTITPNQ